MRGKEHAGTVYRSCHLHALPRRLGRGVRCGAVLAVLLATIPAYAEGLFEIQVLDAENNWPVPLVEMTTTHNVRFVTDNEGTIAFDLPEMMGRETWLHLRGHGYSVDADGFGYRGVRLTPKPGEKIVIQVNRELPAQRLGRITGAGLFAESQRFGRHLDKIESGVVGCDSVQNAQHDGQMYWFWGDTTLANYPLGRFHATGATSTLLPLDKLTPPVALDLQYFRGPRGYPKNVAEMPGPGPTWLTGLASVKDQQGQSQLVATYSKIEPPLSEYERGLCVWDPSYSQFQHYKTLWHRSDSAPTLPIKTPTGHATKYQENGETWLLFGDPFPQLKCKASLEDWSSPKQWQVLNPQTEVTIRGSAATARVHRGAIAWSEYRKRWVTIFTQLQGEKSQLGELWYAEADAPTGPWRDAVHVVTHDHYSFYNPQIHHEFLATHPTTLIFEATYTKTFSNARTNTARHDYNQVLYRLDLDTVADTVDN